MWCKRSILNAKITLNPECICLVRKKLKKEIALRHQTTKFYRPRKGICDVLPLEPWIWYCQANWRRRRRRLWREKKRTQRYWVGLLGYLERFTVNKQVTLVAIYRPQIRHRRPIEQQGHSLIISQGFVVFCKFSRGNGSSRVPSTKHRKRLYKFM